MKREINKVYKIKGLTVKYTGVDKAEVLSSKGSTWYVVTPDNCTCPDFVIRRKGRGSCKHMKIAFDIETNAFGE